MFLDRDFPLLLLIEYFYTATDPSNDDARVSFTKSGLKRKRRSQLLPPSYHLNLVFTKFGQSLDSFLHEGFECDARDLFRQLLEGGLHFKDCVGIYS